MISSLRSVFEGAPEPEEEPALPPIAIGLGPLLDLLENQRRRQLINVLAQCDRLTVGDAAEIMAPREYDKPASQLTRDQRKRLYVSVYQTHAEKLDAHGLVEYDEDRGIITSSSLTETADVIAGALDDATDDEGESE